MEPRPSARELTERIEQAIRDIGYKRNAIARSLKMGTTHTIGLTVPHITNPFFTDVVSVIQQAFDRAGYAVMLCCTDEGLDNQDDQIRLLLDRMVDGLIVARVGDDAKFRRDRRRHQCASRADRPRLRGCRYGRRHPRQPVAPSSMQSPI